MKLGVQQFLAQGLANVIILARAWRVSFKMPVAFRLFLLSVACLILCAQSFSQDRTAEPAKAGEVVAQLAEGIGSVESVVSSPWVKEWVASVSKLPPIQPRTVQFKDKELTIDEAMYYSSRYGSPLAYSRALDLAVAAGLKAENGSRIFDFGYGSIGHLKMLAHLGHVVDDLDARRLGHALGWDVDGGMKLETDLFAWYTIVRKKPEAASPKS